MIDITDSNPPITIQRVALPTFEPLKIGADSMEVIRTAIPRRLSFRMPTELEALNNSAQLDYRWLLEAVGKIDERDQIVISRRYYQVGTVISESIDQERFRYFVTGNRLDISQHSIYILSQELTEQDQWREVEREPTFMQLLKHALGIEAVP